jgi:hypothetical protein
MELSQSKAETPPSRNASCSITASCFILYQRLCNGHCRQAPYMCHQAQAGFVRQHVHGCNGLLHRTAAFAAACTGVKPAPSTCYCSPVVSPYRTVATHVALTSPKTCASLHACLPAVRTVLPHVLPCGLLHVLQTDLDMFTARQQCLHTERWQGLWL